MMREISCIKWRKLQLSGCWKQFQLMLSVNMRQIDRQTESFGTVTKVGRTCQLSVELLVACLCYRKTHNERPAPL